VTIIPVGNFTSIDDPEEINGGAAYGSNDSGQIIGSYASSPTNQQGFVYGNDAYTPLNNNGSAVVPQSINSSGEIVGFEKIINPDFSTSTSGFVYNNGTYTLYDAYQPDNQTFFEGVND
jgi:hypothetical protein